MPSSSPTPTLLQRLWHAHVQVDGPVYQALTPLLQEHPSAVQQLHLHRHDGEQESPLESRVLLRAQQDSQWRVVELLHERRTPLPWQQVLWCHAPLVGRQEELQLLRLEHQTPHERGTPLLLLVPHPAHGPQPLPVAQVALLPKLAQHEVLHRERTEQKEPERLVAPDPVLAPLKRRSQLLEVARELLPLKPLQRPQEREPDTHPAQLVVEPLRHRVVGARQSNGLQRCVEHLTSELLAQSRLQAERQRCLLVQAAGLPLVEQNFELRYLRQERLEERVPQQRRAQPFVRDVPPLLLATARATAQLLYQPPQLQLLKSVLAPLYESPLLLWLWPR